jgi:hypothetical protein
LPGVAKGVNVARRATSALHRRPADPDPGWPGQLPPSDAGKRLFADGAIPTALEPVGVPTTKGGTIVGVYRPNGEPSYDSY